MSKLCGEASTAKFKKQMSFLKSYQFLHSVWPTPGWNLELKTDIGWGGGGFIYLLYSFIGLIFAFSASKFAGEKICPLKNESVPKHI